MKAARNAQGFAGLLLEDDPGAAGGWLFYDAACPFCARLAQRFAPRLRRAQIETLPLQTPWVERLMDERRQDLLKEIRFLDRGGRLLGGADALVAVARRFWWTRPALVLTPLPGVLPLLRLGYAWFAARRHCAFTPKKNTISPWLKWGPPFLPPLASLLALNRVPPWQFMWLMAFALFAAAKWVTLVPLFKRNVPLSRLAAYSFLWPGLDAESFCLNRSRQAPTRRDWRIGVFKTVLGGVLLATAVSLADFGPRMVIGWLGMIGIVMFLHFGLFQLLSLAWRARGVDAQPIMRTPARAPSLAKLWSGAWNTGFTDLMHGHVFLPIAKRHGLRRGAFLVFLLSGLLHELVITIPAGAGYGLPTTYFLLQNAGVAVERSDTGHRMGLRHGLRGSAFILAVAALPAFLLFPPSFIHKVILPMIEAFKI